MNKKGILNIVSIIVDILATIIAVVVILNLTFTNAKSETVNQSYDNLYMSESTVIDVSSDNIVTVETVDNEIFSFKGNGTWLVNDEVTLLLDNQGTENITDDIIINTHHDMR